MQKLLIAVMALGIMGMIGCNPTSHQPTSVQQHAGNGAIAGSISRDGKWAFVSSSQHGLSWWDVTNNELIYTWKQQQGENLVLATAISDDNLFALSADSENFALWDTQTGENIGFWKVRESTIRDIAVSNQGKHILIGKTNGTVLHITVESGRRLEFLGHSEKINSVDMSPNGRYALSGANDYLAYLWDTQSGQVVHRFTHPSRVSKVKLDSQGRFAFTADSKKQATIWQVNTGQPISQLSYTSRQMIFSAVQFSPDGSMIATGSPTRKLRLWNANSGELLGYRDVTPKANTKPASAVINSVAFNENGDTLLTESSSGMLEFWPISSITK